MAGNQSAWRNRPVDLTKNTLSDGRDLSSGRKEDDEEKKKKKKATVTYNRPVVGQDPAERPEGTANVTGVNSRAEAIEAYRADREKTQEKARQEYKSAIKQYQLKTGKTVDSQNAVTAQDRLWNRGSNAPKKDAYSDTTRRIVEARRNTKQKKQELEDYDNQEYDWTDANARKAHEEGRKKKEAAVSQAEQEQNQATAESDRAIIGGLSDEGLEKLTEYAKQKDRATGPRRESGSEIEQWFAENQHMNADELGNLAETVIRDKNAAHMEQEQQWARDVADAHPFAASAVTVPANLVSGVASTVGNLGQAIDQKLNGEGHYTGLDPNSEANLLQSMSGAARGEVKGNIVGDGSDPLRAIAGGAYDVGMGMADTGARIALGALTGGGSALGAGIAGANNFGSAMQSAASRGANADQALLYATASATVDALTEKIPLDNLINISTAKGGAGYILNFLRSMGIEGGQEAASQLASLFADAAIMRDKSERNLAVAQMMTMNPDMSLEEAQASVDRGTVNDILYSMIVSGFAGGFGSLVATTKYKLAHRGEDADVPEAAAQNPQEQPAREAAEAPDSEKAAPLDGEQMARALAGQEQPARAGDLLAESEAEFDKAFDRVMNEESQKPTPESQSQTPESQTEAPKTDTEMDRRAKMALGMEDGQGSAEPAAGQKNTAGSGGIWNKLRSYSQEQIEDWKSSKRIVLCDSIDQFKQFVKNALSGEEKTNKKMYFGAIGNELASDISKSTGLDVNGYNLTLGEDEIRKIKKSHGDESKEAPRGQRAVTEADYIAIPDIVQNADSIKRSDSDYNGKPAIEFRKANGNETTTVVAVVSDKRLDVFVQTEYVNKKAGSMATPESVQADSFTSETPGGTAPSSEATSAGGAASNTTIQQNVSEVNRLSDSARAADSQGMSTQDGQPTAQNAQQQPKVQNEQPVQQQAAPREMPQEAQGGVQAAETNGQAQTPGGYVPGAQASAEGGNGTAGAAKQNFSGKAEYENLLTDENTQRSRPGDVRPMNVPKRDADGKRVTEFAGNAYGAKATPDRMASEIETLVQDGSLSFDTRTNQQSLEQAADYIGKRGADTVRGEITARAASGKMDDGDIEKAMLLYTRYANDDSPKSQEAASEMMVALSSMANKTGRNLQMFGMMRKMTPEGQLMTVEKTVEQNVKRLQQRGRVKKDYVSDGVDAELEADYLKAAKKAKKATDPEAQKAAAKEMRAAEDAIYKAEAAKMPATFAAKWNAWRYMSMMGNVRTNVRNIAGNAAFVPYKIAKDKLGALAEKVLLPKDQRTKSLVQDADLLAWAKEDTKTDLVQDALQLT